MTEETSRYIPVEIKRQVRMRCFFGCVICGLPIYHYDHIEEFSEVQEHKADNLTLLCPTHHQEKTSKRLPISIVRKCNNKPYNSVRANTSPHNWFFSENVVSFNIGGSYFSTDIPNDGDSFDAIRFQGETVAGFTRREGNLLLNLIFRDVLLNPILIVKESEVVISTNNLDISIEGQVLKIKPPFNFHPIHLTKRDDGIDISKGFFMKPGSSLAISPDRITINPGNSTISNMVIMQCRTGIDIG